MSAVNEVKCLVFKWKLLSMNINGTKFIFGDIGGLRPIDKHVGAVKGRGTRPDVEHFCMAWDSSLEPIEDFWPRTPKLSIVVG